MLWKKPVGTGKGTGATSGSGTGKSVSITMVATVPYVYSTSIYGGTKPATVRLSQQPSLQEKYM